uniref:Olfactory receptor n=1 Tax=Catagonus wagneri TaxID=51154 RepID=A0A8C3WDL2_9CETA
MQSRNVNPQRENNLKITETNLTIMMEFVLLGFGDIPQFHWFLFGVFLVIYLIILLGNAIIILITKADATLHTPMYFFLSIFSFLEICYVSVTLPRMLMDFWTQKGSISFLTCATQLFFFFMLGGTECFLLAVMAYDRYVAICNPLHYPLVMNPEVCVQLVVASWISGIPIEIGLTCQIFSLPFCGSNQINHFFCDTPPLLKISCGDIFVNELVVYICALLFATLPFMLILGSYIRIISTIVKLPSETGRAKAFSTCSSHIIVVLLFYGSVTVTYLKPKSNQYEGIDKLLSLVYTVLTPVLNPMIYSLRNKDVRQAMRKFLPKLLTL